MRYLFFTILVLSAFAHAAQAQMFYGTTDIQAFRAGRDKDFRNPQYSPLLAADLQNFKGLKYFAIDAKYQVKVKFTPTPDEKFFWMPTSAGNSHKYIRVGILSFQLDGKEYTLNAYQSESVFNDPKLASYKNSLFIPFKDLTNSKETYGAGRYVYLTAPKTEEAVLDFNLAFNPSCAYSDKFACPLPPKENHLQVEIRAGEQNYFTKAEKTQETK